MMMVTEVREAEAPSLVSILSGGGGGGLRGIFFSLGVCAQQNRSKRVCVSAASEQAASEQQLFFETHGAFRGAGSPLVVKKPCGYM